MGECPMASMRKEENIMLNFGSIMLFSEKPKKLK